MYLTKFIKLLLKKIQIITNEILYIIPYLIGDEIK